MLFDYPDVIAESFPYLAIEGCAFKGAGADTASDAKRFILEWADPGRLANNGDSVAEIAAIQRIAAALLDDPAVIEALLAAWRDWQGQLGGASSESDLLLLRELIDLHMTRLGFL
jgi:hypothetical protein